LPAEIPEHYVTFQLPSGPIMQIPTGKIVSGNPARRFATYRTNKKMRVDGEKTEADYWSEIPFFLL
jgi:hypothetical protein